MNCLKQSFMWWSFANGCVDAESLMRAAKEIGYEGVEFIDHEHLQLAKDCGLKIVAIKGHESLTDGLNRREHQESLRKEILSNLDLAVKWNIPHLICFSGNRNGLNEAEGAEITAENLQAVTKQAEDAGVTLILELLNSKVDHKDYQCDTTAWGIKVCQMVNSHSVKLLYDIYHMQIMEGDIIRTINENHKYFAHYHTAGNPGRHDLDDEQELNYPPIMRTILATGYDGYVGQEFMPKDDPIAALKSAFELCNVSL